MAQYQNLSIYDLTLDLSNPRIRRFLEKYGSSPTAEQISLALGAGTPEDKSDSGPSFHSLKESIRTNGGIIQPIIVNRTENGEKLVIEGNTRVAIFREFDEKKVKGNWKKIPAILYEKLGPQEIDAIRLQAHLVGPRQWDPYSKAKYLNYLRDCKHMTMYQIIDYCGGNKREVENYIAAYEDMEKYYRPILSSDDEFDPTRFSAFVEAQKSVIKSSIVSAGFDMTDFSEWVKDYLISPLSTVRQLPQILSNNEAREVFLKEGAKEALKILETSDVKDLKDASIETLAAALYKKISNLPYSEFSEMKKDLENKKVVALFNLEEEIIDFCKELRE